MSSRKSLRSQKIKCKTRPSEASYIHIYIYEVWKLQAFDKDQHARKVHKQIAIIWFYIFKREIGTSNEIQQSNNVPSSRDSPQKT